MLITLVILATIAGGVWVTIIARRDIALAWQSRKWPCVMGQITEKRILSGTCLDLTNTGTGAPIVRRWRELELVYSYRVDDVDYVCDRFDFSGYGTELNTHYYEDHEKVCVHYCPTDPSIAVLHPGMRSTLLSGPLLIIAGLCSIGFLL